MNWRDFLKSTENKSRLFHFLATMVVQELQDIFVVATLGDTVISTRDIAFREGLTLTNHEEGDTRVLLHAFHQAQCDYNFIAIRTVDSDVVVIATALFQQLQIENLFVIYGHGAKTKILPIHDITYRLGPDRSRSLLFLHAFSGCDTTSSFAFHGKHGVWKTWKAVESILPTFVTLSTSGAPLLDCHFTDIQRFVVVLYEKSSGLSEVNSLRKELFTRKTAGMERLPPTAAALEQHTKRAYLQAQIWASSCCPELSPLDPGLYGWVKHDGSWEPFWTNLPEAATICKELLKCGCKTKCKNRCKCAKASLKCTDLCSCKGCDNQYNQ